ncbi:MAG: ankyrin repeat domain-containing protein [Candidatus Babeliaceae bacterium]|jgi:hypothetical protein
MKFNTYNIILFLLFLSQHIVHAGNTQSSKKQPPHNIELDIIKRKPYLTHKLKKVPSLKVLAGLATVTYKSPEQYTNTKKIPKTLVKYLTFLNEYKNNYSAGLIIAAAQGKTERVQSFLDLGVPVDTPTHNQEIATPLLWAAQEGHLSVVQLLQQNGANIHATTSQGLTALILGAHNKHYDVCQYCIAQGIDINAQSQLKNTALHCTMRNGCIRICKLLLNNGALTQLINNKGKTALQRALEKQKEINPHKHEKQENYEIIIGMLLVHIEEHGV